MASGTFLDDPRHPSAGEEPPTVISRKPPAPPAAQASAPLDLSEPSIEATAHSFQYYRRQLAGQADATPEPWAAPFPGKKEHVRLFQDLYRHDPQVADRLARALTSMPDAGSEFLGFHLSAELGRGSFAASIWPIKGTWPIDPWL